MSGSSSEANAGDVRSLIARHGDHHLARLEDLASGGHAVAGAVAAEAVDPDTAPHRQVEVRSVGFEEIGHGVLGREVAGGARHAHSVETVEGARREQLQRVPAPAPLVADPLVRIEDHKRHVATLEVVADREARPVRRRSPRRERLPVAGRPAAARVASSRRACVRRWPQARCPPRDVPWRLRGVR